MEIAYAGERYLISEEEQKEFGFDFVANYINVAKADIEFLFQVSEKYCLRIVSNYRTVNMDAIYCAGNTDNRVKKFLDDNIKVDKDDSSTLCYFGNCSSSGKVRVVNAELAKESLKNSVMPLSEEDWANWRFTDEDIKEQTKNRDDVSAEILNKMQVKSKIIGSYLLRVIDSDHKEKVNSNSPKRKTREKESLSYLAKEKRRWIFLNSRLHILESFGISEKFFEDIGDDKEGIKLKIALLDMYSTFESSCFKLCNIVLNDDSLDLERRKTFLSKLMEEFDREKNDKELGLNYFRFKKFVADEIKKDEKLKKRVVNKLVSDYLGVSGCGFVNEYSIEDLEANWDLFEDIDGFIKANKIADESEPLFSLFEDTKRTEAFLLLSEKERLDEICSQICLDREMTGHLSHEQIVNFYKYAADVSNDALESFNHLKPDLKLVFIRNFDRERFNILSETQDFLQFLSANEAYQNFLMLYPDKFFALEKMHKARPHFLNLKPLSKIVMFFEVCQDFDWKDEVLEKFCSVDGKKYIFDKNFVSLISKCQNAEQMKAVIEIFHAGGNKMDSKLEMQEINHFQILCKMLKDFTADDDTYKIYCDNLARIYAHAKKIGLFKDQFVNELNLRLDEIILLEISMNNDITEKLISGKVSFDKAGEKVLSDDYLLFGWIESANLKFSDYQLYLVQSLFYNLRGILAEAKGDNYYNAVNNIYELRKFICRLSSDNGLTDLKEEDFIKLNDQLREIITKPGCLSMLNNPQNQITNFQDAIKVVNSLSGITSLMEITVSKEVKVLEDKLVSLKHKTQKTNRDKKREKTLRNRLKTLRRKSKRYLFSKKLNQLFSDGTIFISQAENLNRLKDFAAELKSYLEEYKDEKIGQMLDCVQQLLSNFDVKSNKNLATEVCLLNYFNEQYIKYPYWCHGFLTSVNNTIFDLADGDIENKLNKFLVAAEGTVAAGLKTGVFSDVVLLKFYAQKSIFDSRNCPLSMVNIMFLCEKLEYILTKNMSELNDAATETLKCYIKNGQLNDEYIKSTNLEQIRNELLGILRTSHDGDLSIYIRNYLYPYILLVKKLIPKAKEMINEKRKTRLDEINSTAIPQILKANFDPEDTRRYFLSVLCELDETNFARIKDIISENPDDITLIHQVFNIMSATKNKTLEQKEITYSLQPDKQIDNTRFIVKADLNNMFVLFQRETFSFLKSNPNVVETLLSLKCVNVHLLNADNLNQIAQLSEHYEPEFLADYLRVVLNAVNFVEEEQQAKCLSQLLNRSYINFMARSEVLRSRLFRNPRLGIIMNYLSRCPKLIMQMMQDENAVDLLEKICFLDGNVYAINQRFEKLISVYGLYPEEIKKRMTVKQLMSIKILDLQTRKSYENILRESIRDVKWYQRKKTLQEKMGIIVDVTNTISRKVVGNNKCKSEALSTAVNSLIKEEIHKANRNSTRAR